MCFGLNCELCANTLPSGYLTHDTLSGHPACDRLLSLQFPAGLPRKLALAQSRATCSSLLPHCALCRVVSLLIGSLVGRDLERCSKEVLGRGMNIAPNRAQVLTILAGSSGVVGVAVLQHGQALRLCCHRTRDYPTSIVGWGASYRNRSGSAWNEVVVGSLWSPGTAFLYFLCSIGLKMLGGI